MNCQGPCLEYCTSQKWYIYLILGILIGMALTYKQNKKNNNIS